jgi:hypothetical protein
MPIGLRGVLKLIGAFSSKPTPNDGWRTDPASERGYRGGMGIVPAFYTRISSPRYGTFSMDVYHDRRECLSAQKILEDHNEILGKGGRRPCSECRKHGAV